MFKKYGVKKNYPILNFIKIGFNVKSYFFKKINNYKLK